MLINFIFKRIILMTLFVFLLTVISFWMHLRLSDSSLESFLYDYLTFTNNFIHFDFGTSIRSGLPVIEDMKLLFPATIELIVLSFILSFVVGTTLGIFSGLKHHSLFDTIIRTYAQFSSSIPTYWFAFIILIILCVNLKVLPMMGNINLLYDVPTVTGFLTIDAIIHGDITIIIDMVKHFILPIICVSLIPCSEFIGITRIATIQILHKNYILAKLSSGINDIRLIYVHILPNLIPTILPRITTILCNIFSAVIVIEIIFEWPGIGPLLIQSIKTQDYAVIVSTTFTVSLCLLTINILTELINVIFYPSQSNHFNDDKE